MAALRPDFSPRPRPATRVPALSTSALCGFGCRGSRPSLNAAETTGIRIIVSAEDVAELDSLRTRTRGLMADAEHNLSTKLDWVAVEHWNTDNPHATS
jgi:hypothetical protein